MAPVARRKNGSRWKPERSPSKPRACLIKASSSLGRKAAPTTSTRMVKNPRSHPPNPCAPRRAFHRARSRIACALFAALVVERCVLAHRGWAGAIVEILDHPVFVPPPSQHSIHKRGGTTAESRFPKNRERGHAPERGFPGCQSRMGGGLEREGSQDDRRRAEVEKTEQR